METDAKQSVKINANKPKKWKKQENKASQSIKYIEKIFLFYQSHKTIAIIVCNRLHEI